MAIVGNGREYDITFIAGASLKTSTSQYHVVGLVPTTTVGDRTVVDSGATNGTVCGVTVSAAYAIGIVQTPMMSAASEQCTVRMFGVSKAVCAESISAGAPILAYHGASTSTRLGQIVQLDDGATCTAYGATVTAICRVLGFALEDGSTNTNISVMINPSHYDWQLVGSIGIT